MYEFDLVLNIDTVSRGKHTHTHTHTYTNTNTHTHTHTHTHKHTYTNINTKTYTTMHTHPHKRHKKYSQAHRYLLKSIAVQIDEHKARQQRHSLRERHKLIKR